MDVPSTEHRRQMSAEPIARIQCGRNEQRKERHSMPHNERWQTR